MPSRSQTAPPASPEVRLGALQEGGLAPVIMAIVVRAEIELNMDQGYPPVRIAFEERHVLVEDGPGRAPDLRVSGALSDLVGLMVTPLVGGLPSPVAARGRAALGMVALRRVRVQGRIGLMRRWLRLIAV